MYLKLKEAAYGFERIFDAADSYFNISDYQAYAEEDMRALISAEIYAKSDFLLMPRLNRHDIAIAFLQKWNHRSLLRQQTALTEPEFFHLFHWYLEDHRLTAQWKDFETSALLAFAEDWCRNNAIAFTLK